MNILKLIDLKKFNFLTLLSLSFLFTDISCQQINNYGFEAVISELPDISRDTLFNDLICIRNMDYKTYNELTKNFITYDSVYCYNERNRKYSTTWSGLISSDSSIVDIDNTDKNGKIIPDAPTQIIYHNKICFLGKVNLNPNFTVVLIKVETYGTFVIHLFSYNKAGNLISVIPVGKIETGPNKKNWFTIQSGKWNKNNSIWASYLAAAYVELTYTFTEDGRFKVIKRQIEN